MNSGVFREGASRGGYKPLPPKKDTQLSISML